MSVSTSSATQYPHARLMVLWAKIVLAFLAASSVQALFYGAPAIFGFSGYHVSGPLYLPVVLAYFFAPALAAMAFALSRVVAFYRVAGRSVSILAVAAVIVLAMVSAYMGVFVSFNTWGT